MSDPKHYSSIYYDQDIDWGSIYRVVDWEHLLYNTFPNKTAHSYFYNKKIDESDYFWIFNKGMHIEAKKYQQIWIDKLCNQKI